MRALLLASLVLAAAFAGCATDDEPSTNSTTTPTSTSPATTEPGGKCTSKKDASKSAAEPTWVLETSMGTMRMTLFCDKTPVTAQNIVDLAESGFYDGTRFHRVIEGFMDQGGDPLTKDDAQKSRWGTGDPGYEIQDEFYCADGTIDHEMDDPQYPGRPVRKAPHQACDGALGLKHDSAGTLSMANAGANTGGSQFFITATATPHLDGAHPVFGHTADQASLDVALAINRVPTDAGDRPVDPITVTRSTIEWG